MTAEILNGKLIAQEYLDALTAKVRQVSRKPGLAVFLVGEDPASKVYVTNKIKTAAAVDIHSEQHVLDARVSELELLELIVKANQDEKIDGILVQLPLPAHISTQKVIESVSPLKDVDGFHPENIGLLSLGCPRFVPCTPKGCMELLKKAGVNLLGKHAVIVGRSNIVGKPMAQLLLNSQATVTVCHKNTRDLQSITRQADILIVAAGVPGLITREHVKPGVVVLDIGINRLPNGKLVGDVDFEGVSSVARAITPVPGGVGPMTLAMLMENTWQARALC